MLTTEPENDSFDLISTAGTRFTYTFSEPAVENILTDNWNSVIIGNIGIATQPSTADVYKGGFLRLLKYMRATGETPFDTVKPMQTHCKLASMAKYSLCSVFIFRRKRLPLHKFYLHE